MAELGYIQVTRKCNQNCRFCSNPPTSYFLTLKKAKKLIDKYISEGYAGIILTGGEPTLSKNLPKLIEYCRKKNTPCRIITNGQKLSDFNYLKLLINSGLSHINISIYSHKNKIQSYLTRNSDSLKNIRKALENLGRIREITVNVNIVINKFNANHLSEIAKWIVKNFPFVSHFVWNNLDPLMIEPNSKEFNTVPKLSDFELELYKALKLLSANNKTFRVERVPLCYMTDFAEFSTETRKIVKGEGRIVYFLDKRGLRKQVNWYYEKTECCKVCSLNEICAGLYQMDKYYSSKELFPIFVDRNKIIKRILYEKK